MKKEVYFENHRHNIGDLLKDSTFILNKKLSRSCTKKSLEISFQSLVIAQ